MTESECRDLLNMQPSWNLGPFALLNLGYRAGLERAAQECDELRLYDPTPTAESLRPTTPQDCAAAIRKEME